MPKKKILINKYLISLIFILSIILPFIIFVKPIINGNIAFWYDPARDLLLAWDNLKKPTLIGPPTGIPGLFYGPYWIWILSLAMIISKDPRIVVFLTETVPYFFILPFILFFLFKKLFDKNVSVLIWLFFIFTFTSYIIQIWNPNLAPLIFFVMVSLINETDFNMTRSASIKKLFALGIVQGLLLNFHISFGLGILLSVNLFLFIWFIIGFLNKKTKKLTVIKNGVLSYISFYFGIVLIFLPFLFFELRHGFNQIKSLVTTLDKALLQNSAIVGQVGLNKGEIIARFINRLPMILHIPSNLSVSVNLVFICLLLALIFFKKNKLDIKEKNIIAFLTLNIIGVLTIYLTSKNPVWDYHFIGTEVIVILLFAFILKKFKVIIILATIWIIVLLFINFNDFTRSFQKTNMVSSDLTAKKTTVEKIFADSKRQPFSYFAYNQAIYTYDYDYLFRWLGQKNGFLPESNASNFQTTYLIIPPELIAYKDGFIDNKTPNNTYLTTSQWVSVDGTLIIKRKLKISK